jgi:hypothetical protein
MTIPRVPTPGYEPGKHNTRTDRIASTVMLVVGIFALLFTVLCIVLVVFA